MGSSTSSTSGLHPCAPSRRDVIGAIGVTAGAAALWPVDDQVDSWIVRHPNAALVRAFTPWDENHPELGDLSTGQRLLPISAVLITSGMIADNRKLREAGWGCLSGWQASSTIRAVMYATISRERPSLNRGDQYAIKTPGGEWDYHSFFAGHAANAWACTTFWNTRFHMGASRARAVRRSRRHHVLADEGSPSLGVRYVGRHCGGLRDGPNGSGALCPP